MYDFVGDTTRILHRAADLAGLDEGARALLERPLRMTTFRIPVQMDDGSTRVFDAYRAQYNDALGPTRDGTRVTPDIDVAEVRSLALIMSIKHAAGGIPAGGGKGGIAADPRELSRREFEMLCRGYMRRLRPRGPGCDVPGADIGTDLQTMSWMLDEYESMAGHHAPAAVNDKPLILRGLPGSYDATGHGVFDVFEEAAGVTGLSIAGARVAIQGFGQVGSVAASRFQEAGCRVVGVADSGGGVYAEDGLDIAALREYVRGRDSVAGFPDAEPFTNSELLACDCDVLVPAAVQGVINGDNVDSIRANMVVEAANAPMTVEAENVLLDRGVTVVPDILANAGSVQLCQMERTQGLADDFWDLEIVDRLRHERLTRAYREALNTAARCHVNSVRLGAWVNALERIAEAMRLRGWC